MDSEHLLDGLNPSQRSAVTSPASPLCILAAAGSGKTRVLTRRIAYRVADGTADAPHVLALTFTRKAAGELAARLQALGVRDRVVTGTFHSVALAQLRRRWADRGQAPPAILDRKARLLAPLLPRRPAASGATVQPVDVAAEIEWAKARLVGPDRYEEQALAARRRPPLAAGQMAALYARYEAEKRRRGLVDFDDLLVQCVDALERDTEFAATQRWRFRHLFVDEFQDVNPAQVRLLDGWVGGRTDLCVVGDPNQAIYSWNGADSRLLTEFTGRHPDAEVIRLDDTYRSSPQILAVATAVLAGGGGDVPRLRSHQPEGPVPSVSSYESDVAEARGIAARLRRAHRPGTPWSHLAVLMRTNAQTVLFEEALRAARIPSRVRGGGAFLDQPEVRAALDEIGRDPAGRFADALVDLQAMASEEGGTEERRLSLESLVRLGQEHLALDPDATVGGFRSWLVATVRAEQPDAGGDAVELVTFHRAKGLEWPVVFVAGLERGLVPIGRADSAEASAEERRLLYVAVTRARDELHCSWAQRRTIGSRSLPRSPSPYLECVEAACRALHQGVDVDWRTFLAEGRRRLDGGAGAPSGAERPGRGPTGSRRRAPVPGRANPDPDLLAALKTWRTAAARAAAVPAYVIFHDTTLAAVAEALPADRDDLLAIPGLGPVKVERYGDALLSVVAEYRRSA